MAHVYEDQLAQEQEHSPYQSRVHTASVVYARRQSDPAQGEQDDYIGCCNRVPRPEGHTASLEHVAELYGVQAGDVETYMAVNVK